MKTMRVTPEWEDSLMNEGGSITTETATVNGEQFFRVAVNGYGVVHLQKRDPLIAAFVVHGIRNMLENIEEHSELVKTAEKISEGFMEMEAKNPYSF